MKFDTSSLAVIVISVAGSWTGLSLKYDEKLDALSKQIDACACPKGEAALASNAEKRRRVTKTGAGVSPDASPFTKEGDWWGAAGDAMFLIPGGLVVGSRNDGCTYGDAVLSVDTEGTNCPSGRGSVTLGHRNTARGKYSSVTGGYDNTAAGEASSVSGGVLNRANTGYSSVSGGADNRAAGSGSSVSGGGANVVTGIGSSVSGGYKNVAAATRSSIFGGNTNSATGEVSSVSGGMDNSAKKRGSSITGGVENRADRKFSTILGGNKELIEIREGAVGGNKELIETERKFSTTELSW